MISTALLGMTLVAALADWWAVARDRAAVEYIAKPAVIIFLLLWLWRVRAFHGPLGWFALGLGFSLLGDILLMLPHGNFTTGLAAFLLAQLAYLVGLNNTLPTFSLPGLILFLGLGVTSVSSYRRIAAGLEAKKKSGLKIPVLAYLIVLSLMVFSALLAFVRVDWRADAAFLVSGGAVLFYLSDTLLAWDRFVATLPHGKLRVHATYHLGQILLIAGAVLHFPK